MPRRTFTGRGDPELGNSPHARGATRKLDYIKDLGFNRLQLLPHTEFGGVGHNPRLMHAVHGPYGDSLEFAELVERRTKEARRGDGGRRCITGAPGNSLWEYDGWSQDDNGGIYFEKAGDTGWGQSFAFWKEEVQEYLSATMDTWLGEYNCDGVRIDSAHSMPPDFVRRVTNRARQFDGRFVVVEHTRGRARSGRARRGRVLAVQQLRQLRGDDQLLEENMERLEAVARAPEEYRATMPSSSARVARRHREAPGARTTWGTGPRVSAGAAVARARVHAPVVGRRRRRRRHPHAVHGRGGAQDGH